MNENILLKNITVNPQFQVRAKLNMDAVKDYTTAYQDKVELPPITVIRNTASGTSWVVDGFHRIEARKAAGFDSISCEVIEGTSEDALRYALETANSANGMRYTSKDKRKRVTLFLSNPNWIGKSDAAIAKACCVDPKTIAKVRKDLQLEDPEVRVGTDGRHVTKKPTRPSREIPDKDSVESTSVKDILEETVAATKGLEAITDLTTWDTAKAMFGVQLAEEHAKLQEEIHTLKKSLEETETNQTEQIEALKSQLHFQEAITKRCENERDEAILALEARNELESTDPSEDLGDILKEEPRACGDCVKLQLEITSLQEQLSKKPQEEDPFVVLDGIFNETKEESPHTFKDAVVLATTLLQTEDWSEEEYMTFCALLRGVKDLYPAAKKKWGCTPT
jgi:hypothetical protein